MNTYKREKILLKFTYLFTIICFFNLALIQSTFDKGAMAMAGILCVLLAYSHFIIRKFFPEGDKYILIFANILSVIGIVMLYRLNKLESIKQVMWFTVGICLFIFIVVLLPDLKRFSKYKYFYMIVTIAFMALGTLFGKEKFGSKNWVKIGGFGFQPSEFGKLALVAYLSAALKDYEHKMSKFIEKHNLTKKNSMEKSIQSIKILLEPAIVVMLSLGFMVLQKDLGSALIFFGISITMLYIGTSKTKYVIVCFFLFILGGIISYQIFGHVRVRVNIWENPWKYGNKEGYQLVQSLIAIVSGGFFGSGLGLGQPKVIPVVTSDFIFAAICEEMGIITGIAIMLLYFLLFYRCMRAAINTDDDFSKLLAVGYSTMIASQVLVIIGGVTGAIPLTGITLPFVSYGGTSMVIVFFALGILQKISEEGR
ncbi:FtsW/RodA/SpoVE family cell cycle protein [Hathewaya histolytica]|uniref:FtsW/RodA/SpoVE family cell cycle protein n=1 Tax=Hathewaya histolytica TaxID=1498 RepID=UPI003B67ED6C